MNTSPLVSVCIPTYRGAEFLRDAIQSVLNQKFSNFELIIIDDNSPDNTAEIVSQFQDARIKYIKNPVNLGPEGNWNRCLTEATGKYFKLLPHDDLLAENCLQNQVYILENDVEQHLALVFCSRNIIDHQQHILMQRSYQSQTGLVNGQQLLKKSIRKGTNLLGEPGAVLFRKSLADRIGLFDGSIAYIIDLDYWSRLLLHGDAYYFEQPLASFRVAHGSWSIDIGANQSKDFINFIKRCAVQPEYNLSVDDILLGKIMAKINNLLRLFFYKFYLSHINYANSK